VGHAVDGISLWEQISLINIFKGKRSAVPTSGVTVTLPRLGADSTNVFKGKRSAVPTCGVTVTLPRLGADSTNVFKGKRCAVPTFGVTVNLECSRCVTLPSIA
jgi:hypothetical protein